jgi:hypothetical protein
METLRHGEDEISPTRGIYWALKPYWQRKALDDQHWAYVLACLRKIETRCRECRDLAEVNLKVKCVECIERKLIEAI